MSERTRDLRDRARTSMRRSGGRHFARRGLSYGAVLLAGVSLAAMLLPERTATAQNQPTQRQLELEVISKFARYEQAGKNFRDEYASIIRRRVELFDQSVARCRFEDLGRLMDEAARLRDEMADILPLMQNDLRDPKQRQTWARFRPHLRGAPDFDQLDALVPTIQRYISTLEQLIADTYEKIKTALADGSCPSRPLMACRATDKAPEIKLSSDRYFDQVAQFSRAAANAAASCRRDAYAAQIGRLRALVRAARANAEVQRRVPEGHPQYYLRNVRADTIDADADAMERHAQFMEVNLERCLNCPTDAAPPPPSPPQTTAPPPSNQAQRPPATPPGPPRGPAVPGVSIEPFFKVAIRFNDASGAYSSNGGQAPGSGTGDKQQGNFGGGVEGYVTLTELAGLIGLTEITGGRQGPFLLGATQAGLRFGIFQLGSGDKVVFSEVRHGADGRVEITERETVEIQLLFLLRQYFYWDFGALFGEPGFLTRAGEQYADNALAQAPALRPRNYWPFALYFGVGPSFVRTEIKMTSNQVPGGGVFQSASEKKWDTGVSFVVGGQTALCRNCAFGNPVMFGIEGQWTHLPARNIGITSSTFGFTEQGRISSRSASKITFKITMPFGIGR